MTVQAPVIHFDRKKHGKKTLLHLYKAKNVGVA